MKIISIMSALALVPFGLLHAQAPKGTARIAIEGPANVEGRSSIVNIRLLDAHGRPVAAESDVKLRVDAQGANVNQEVITIPKGSDSAQVAVSRDKPGLSDLHIEQAGVPAGGLTADAQIGFSATDGYAPVAPLRLHLSVQPDTKLKAGIENAKIIVRYMDSHKVSIPAKQDIQVSFPGLSDRISPYPIRIASGAPFAEAQIAGSRPEIIPLNPVVSPPLSIVSDTNAVEFVSPIVGLRLIADPSYIERARRPKIAVKIGLVDAEGNWISSDKDRTILLHVEPSTGGTVAKTDITIPKGSSVAETTFQPLAEGKSVIKAVVGEGLIVETADVEFKYAYIYFWGIAALGGFIGGVIRNAVGSDHSAKTVVVHCIGGCATGLLVYLLLPLMVSLSLKPVNLQNASKVFEAFAWGFIGGGTGTALLGKIISSTQHPKTANH